MTALRHILLAEDNANDIELTLIALREHRASNAVHVVRDGSEALDYLYCRGTFQYRTNGNPLAILLDLKMPKVDGLTVLREMKSQPNLQTIPVVMLTSSREEQDLARSYQLGVNAYVVKPVGFPEFMEAIGKLGVFWGVINEPPPANTDGNSKPPANRATTT